MSAEHVKKVYLLPGWGFSVDIWATVERELGYFCDPECLDIWEYFPATGQGDSSQLEQILEKIFLASEAGCIWVAWSMSGLVLSKLAERYPGHVSGVVYVASSPKFVSDDEWVFAIHQNEFQSFRDNFRREPLETIRQFSRLVMAGDAEAGLVKKELRRCLLDPNASHSVLCQGLDLMANLDCRDVIANLNIPELFILGEKDYLLKSQHLDCLTATVKAPVHLMEGASHALFLGQNEVFCRYIKNFMLKIEQ